MLIISNLDDFFKALGRSARTAKECYISSYSIYAGITWDNVCTVTEFGYDNGGFKFFNLLEKRDVRTSIIVGKPMVIECRPGCPYCMEKQNQQVERIYNHQRRWPYFDWNICKEHHAKYIIFDNHDCFIGGRNVTDSSFFDLSFFVNDASLFEELKTIHRGKVLAAG